jgi:uncharacterized membrane protein YdjX (TVP38/TMEM64 family)
MKKFSSHEAKQLKIALAILGVSGVIGIVLVFTGHMRLFYRLMVEIFQDKEQLRSYIQSWGAWAPTVFITIQSLQVVIAPIPGELTGAVGGLIFGGIPASFYSTIGLTLGSLLAFIAARIVGLPLVKVFVSSEQLAKFHFLTERKGTLLALMLFIIPGFPKDIFCYILGLSPMGFVTFFIVCTIGRLPGTILLSFSGSALYDENWTLLIGLAAAALVLIGGFFLVRNKVDGMLERVVGSRTS